MIADYLIAQYIPDLFRHETRNVGIIVRRENETAARFFGEIEAPAGLSMDGRKLRAFEYPDVYRQWVDYWRSQLRREAGFDSLCDDPRGSFIVRRGGQVSDTEGDPIADVVNFLYSLIVSEGGFAEAIGAIETESRAEESLKDAVGDELDRANVLVRPNEEPGLVRYPVRARVQVLGNLPEPHVPSFVQDNGLLFVMETVDFTSREKDRAKDHAAFASYMFEDIRRAHPDRAHPIAVIRLRPEDREFGPVRYGIAILRQEAVDVVNWLDDTERAAFLADRVRVAMAQ